MKKFSRDSKVKNPCKICSLPVNNKNGLQCQGACKKWTHFTCLKYTPGKIQDIKTGILKVLCPCPDCKNEEHKEFLTSPPYTCPDINCPANQIPKCRSSECPLWKKKKSSSAAPDELSGESGQNDSEEEEEASEQSDSGESNQSVQSYATVPETTPPPSSKKSTPPYKPRSQTSQSRTPSASRMSSKGSRHPPASSDSLREIAHRVCPKHKEDFSERPSLSCSCLSKDSRTKAKVTGVSSDSHIDSKNPKVLYQALEDMCNTVGQLSHQVRDLMCKMIDTIHPID